MAVPTFTATGSKATTAAKLDKSVFGAEVTSHELLKQAYVSQQANCRGNLAQVKTRGLVRGGGKKPWKQKGTGRARFGSSRNPIWRGGGIVFGPTGLENYRKEINTKAKRLALRQALSLAAAENKVKILETFNCKDGKVSATAKLLTKLGVNGSALLVVSQKDDLVERATRNLPAVKAVQANYLNVVDVLNADTLVIDQASLKIVSDWLGGDK